MLLRAETETQNNVQSLYKKLKIKLNDKKTHCIACFNSNPVKDILTTAKQNKVNLIIIGTHGASGIRKVLFGSNTAHVIADSDVPVLAIPGKYAYHPIKELIYATDFENVSGELKILKPLAKELSTKLSAIHYDYGWAREKKELVNRKQMIDSGIECFERKASIEIPIINYLRGHMTKRTNSLLCMFHNSKRGITKLIMGSNSEDLAQGLKSPLLSIQKKSLK